MLSRAVMLTLVLLSIVALTGCGAPGLGERCNPLLFNVSDQCQPGLSCVYPKSCGVAYCCPMTGTSADPNCQACPSDAGASDASSSD
jgi:hypothetical protein